MRVLFSQPILLLLRNKTALPDCKGVVIVGDVGDKTVIKGDLVIIHPAPAF